MIVQVGLQTKIYNMGVAVFVLSGLLSSNDD